MQIGDNLSFCYQGMEVRSQAMGFGKALNTIPGLYSSLFNEY